MTPSDPSAHALCLPADEVIEALADTWRAHSDLDELGIVEAVAYRLSPYLDAGVLDELSAAHAYAEDDDTTEHTAAQKVDAYVGELRAVTRLALAARANR